MVLLGSGTKSLGMRQLMCVKLDKFLNKCFPLVLLLAVANTALATWMPLAAGSVSKTKNNPKNPSLILTTLVLPRFLSLSALSMTDALFFT